MSKPIVVVKECEQSTKKISTYKGAPGKSAYMLALDQGFIGSLEDWLESLKGESGDTGAKDYNQLVNVPIEFPPTVHTHPWVQITGVPLTASRWPVWDEVTNKPSTFIPTNHNHTLADIEGIGEVSTVNFNGNLNNYLRGDGTWGTPSNTTYTAGVGLSLVGTEFQNTAPHIATNLGSSGTGATRTITSSTGTNTTITYSAGDIGAAPTSHTHAWAQITGAPATATRWPAWTEITNKPIIQKQTLTLSSGQRVVNFTSILVENSDFYISGDNVDTGLLLQSIDYTLDTNNNRINLIDSYPPNTRIIGVQNKDVQSSDAGSILEFEQALNY